MKRKIFTIFSAFLLGTVLFWAVLFIAYEIWSGLQSERLRWERFVCNPISGEKKVFSSDSGPVTDEQIANSGFLPLTETEYAKQYLEGVKEFGPLKIGGKAPNGAGSNAPLDHKMIPESAFYIYVQRRGLDFCEFDSCGIAEGKVVQCMGGWLSGDGHPEISDLVGLNSIEVAQGKASIVVVSDKESKIIGIYPNHTEGDILPILNQFPNYEESLLNCVD